MAEHYIRINGEWKNVCSNDIYFRHVATGEWKKFNSGDSVRIGSNWVLVECAPLCGAQFEESGGGIAYPVPVEREIELGNATGIVKLDCFAYTVPDKFEIWWNGSLRATTGYIGYNANEYDNLSTITGEDVSSYGRKQIQFNKTSISPSKATIKIYSPFDSTVWAFVPSCPGTTLIPVATLNILNDSSKPWDASIVTAGFGGGTSGYSYRLGAGESLMAQTLTAGLNDFIVSTATGGTSGQTARAQVIGYTAEVSGTIMQFNDINIPAGVTATLRIQDI